MRSFQTRKKMRFSEIYVGTHRSKKCFCSDSILLWISSQLQLLWILVFSFVHHRNSYLTLHRNLSLQLLTKKHNTTKNETERNKSKPANEGLCHTHTCHTLLVILRFVRWGFARMRRSDDCVKQAESSSHFVSFFYVLSRSPIPILFYFLMGSF